MAIIGVSRIMRGEDAAEKLSGADRAVIHRIYIQRSGFD